jgi:hypothetical protein
MARGMNQYRIYCLNDEGRFSKVEEIEAASDAEALARARATGHSGRCEVWQGKRLVGILDENHGVKRNVQGGLALFPGRRRN